MAASSASFLIVAVDGGAASGKSSLARALAERFGFLHVDTGAHYRTVTLALQQAGVTPEDDAAVAAALARLPLDTLVAGRAAQLAPGGRAPEPAALRSAAVNGQVSRFAAQPRVRRFLFDYQRRQAEVARARGFAGMVMEGRDIGSVIFPDAPVRIFLTADPATRARRRAAEGQTDALAERDRLDATRATAPLTCPPGAMVIDSSSLTLPEVTAQAAALIAAALRPAPAPARVPRPEFPLFYGLTRQVAAGFFQVCGRAEIAGVERVPPTGPCLLASNHASFYDPVIIGSSLPRPISFLPRQTLWRSHPLAWALDHLQCIPLDRDGGAVLGAFKRVAAAVKKGGAVLVFPEGTRTRDGQLQPAQRGVGLLLALLDAPVVPVRVFGTFEAFGRSARWPRPWVRLGVTFGPALAPAALDPGRADPQRHEVIARRIMDAIAALRPPWDTSS